MEVLPRRATFLKTLWLWMRRLWHTTSEVASMKAIPVSSPRRVCRQMHIGIKAVGTSATNRL